MAFFAKSRRKLRTKNFEAHFHRKLRTLEKCSNVKKLRTAEPQPIFTGSYKKKKVYCNQLLFTIAVFSFIWNWTISETDGHLGTIFDDLPSFSNTSTWIRQKNIVDPPPLPQIIDLVPIFW